MEWPISIAYSIGDSKIPRFLKFWIYFYSFDTRR